MYDEQGNLWVTARIRPAANPDFCKKGSDLESAKLFPIDDLGPPAGHARSQDRQVHADQYLLPDPSPGVRLRQERHAVDQRRRRRRPTWSAGSTPRCSARPATSRSRRAGRALIIDTAGLGKREGEYTEPNQPVDPKKQHRINAAFYGVAPSPADNSVWGSVARLSGRRWSGSIPGANPPATALGGNLRRARLPGFRRAAWTSTARAWSGPARERPSGELRPPQVQGPQRSDRDRQALPGRLDALSAIPDRNSRT